MRKEFSWLGQLYCQAIMVFLAVKTSPWMFKYFQHWGVTALAPGTKCSLQALRLNLQKEEKKTLFSWLPSFNRTHERETSSGNSQWLLMAFLVQRNSEDSVFWERDHLISCSVSGDNDQDTESWDKQCEPGWGGGSLDCSILKAASLELPMELIKCQRPQILHYFYERKRISVCRKWKHP